MTDTNKKITHADVRMYRMGTGDCFVVKFFAEKVNTFTIMIDCGTWQGKKQHLEKYIAHLKDYLKEDRRKTKPTIDLLIVTHEHKDHVYGFDVCKELFLQDLEIKKIWMGWTEKDEPTAINDPLDEKLKEWKTEHGQRKKALNVANNEFQKMLVSLEGNKTKGAKAKRSFAMALNQFANLQFSATGQYAGDLEGMRVVKKEIAKNNISFLRPGEIKDDLAGAEGLRFYILGPPTSIEAIKKEGGPVGETFNHSQNNKSTDNNSFAAALLNLAEPQPLSSILPFDESFLLDNAAAGALPDETVKRYDDNQQTWRRIDNDWLDSAGTLALRMNSATNNLSLALAIEFTDSERVMLFPGDAEFGSWESWHTIQWNKKSKDEKKHLTEELLNRTVFYKVAHHLSHNGTAKRLGVEMMKHKDLACMATLDYHVISSGWTNTMPNRDLIADLLTRTKGRVIIMNEEGLYVNQATKKEPLKDRILQTRQQLMNDAEEEEFKKAFSSDEEGLYLQYRVRATELL
ncbi:MBL fold metallo-hydrolase [Emticicia sp. 17c]|uniref:MBL fold metallo-hydrolase n=1 Tax=Emticicia sp. 17c TaxID=3127704 RepID=UPI00301CEF0C